MHGASQLRSHRRTSLPFVAVSTMATFRKGTGASCRRKPFIKWHWTREEDDLLCILVQIHGPGKWDRIAAHIHGRTGKSCRIRWINQLNPRVNKMPFSAEEKQGLLELHREYGNRWSAIVSYFPGRTDNQVKNQYHILARTRYMKALGLSSGTDPHDTLNQGSQGLSSRQSISTVSIGSKFSDVSHRGTNYCGFAPWISAMPDKIEMTLSFIGGPSSVYGKGETFTQLAAPDCANPASIHPRPRTSCGNSMTSDANNSAYAELSPVPQRQQGVGVADYQFIDFMGVGSSD